MARAVKATGTEAVVEMTIEPPFTLVVVFDDGMHRRVNCEDALDGPIFEPLRDPAYFALGTLDLEAGTVVWPNGADLAPEFLYENGIELAPPRP